MQALAIHFGARRHPATAMGLLLMAAALLGLAWVAQDFAEADAQWQTLQARQARQDRQMRSTQPAKRLEVGAAPLARGDAQPGAPIDAHIDTQLQRPWNALLHALEEHSMKDVALISVDAQSAAGSLHLVAEARDMAHALAYVKHLRASPLLSRVYLTGQEEKLSGTQKLIRFSLDADWGAAP